MDLLGRNVKRSGVLIKLTPKEFDVLRYLLERKHRIVTRDVLGSAVLDKTVLGRDVHNLVDVYLSRLRRKIEVGRSKRLIHTVRGKGFTFRDGDESAPPFHS